jgi:Flp pilus assembly protein TadB
MGGLSGCRRFPRALRRSIHQKIGFEQGVGSRVREISTAVNAEQKKSWLASEPAQLIYRYFKLVAIVVVVVTMVAVVAVSPVVVPWSAIIAAIWIVAIPIRRITKPDSD